MSLPRIGVLMPAYNAAAYLRDSISSILNQSVTDFDFIIINDGSTDQSEEVILSFKDPRIKYVKNEKNLGLIGTLNRGLDIIANEYIARMDADDIAMPDRFEKQLRFMDAHPDVVVCGTQIQYFGDSEYTTSFPLSDNELKAKLVFAHRINHPTAMIRNAAVSANNLRYDPQFAIIEDYNFWIRLSRFGKMANLPEVLLRYRWEGQNITAKTWDTRGGRYKSIYAIILNMLTIEPTEKRLDLHLQFSGNTTSVTDLRGIREHMKLLLRQNEKNGVFPTKEFEAELKNSWNSLFYKAADSGSGQAMLFWRLSRRIRFSQVRYFMSTLVKKRSTN